MNPENEIDKTEALEPVETAAANVAEARGGVDGRKRPKWLLPLIAVVCAVVLVVAGIIGWNAYSGAKLAEAKEACATAADTVRNNANEYNALLNGDAADAAAVKAEQVKDAKTVESLGKELKAMAPEYEGCVAENAQGLDAAAVKLNEQADWYETHEKSLSKAVRAVTESKAAKRLDDAKTNLTAKLDEASKLLADSDGKVADNATRDALSNAIDAAGGKPTRAQVVEAMANVEITSITGTFQFDEKGDNINAKAYAYEIVDGYPGKLVGELTGA